MECLLDGSGAQHLPHSVFKEKLSAWKETLPQEAPAHMWKALQMVPVHSLGIYWEIFGWMWWSQEAALPADWCGFDGSDHFHTILYSTAIMVDFPGHKFHGHTCYFQDNYRSIHHKVSTMERMGKSHNEHLLSKCLVTFESSYQSFISKGKFSPIKTSHRCL